MATTTASLSIWIPRIAGVLVCLFLAMFALDGFNEGTPFVQALPDVLVHLIPAIVLLGIVGASFRWPWIGAVAFIGLAAAYAATLSNDRADWMFAISGPMVVVGALFLWSWWHQARGRRSGEV